jgi:hypothetical protein
MKKLLFLFSIVLFLSCGKEQSNTQDFVKDYLNNKSTFINPVSTYKETESLEQRTGGETCCTIFGILEPHNPGIEISWLMVSSPHKKYFLMLYYNPTTPSFGPNQMYYLASGVPPTCGNSIDATISLSTAQSGYYRLYCWIGAENDNFNICSSSTYDYHL